MTKTKPIPYRRRREQKTNYDKRLKLLLSDTPRLVVRITGNRIIGQLTKFSPQGDLVLCAVDSSILKKYGWHYSAKNLPAAYLTGLLLGKAALGKDINQAILDVGLRTPFKKGKIYAFLKGVIDAGLNVPCDENIFPTEKHLTGNHVIACAKGVKSEQQFSAYRSLNHNPENLPKVFGEVKSKLAGAA
jgi:large subunit ribosomal protein L18